MERLNLEECLNILYKNIQEIRLKNKTKEDYDKVYLYVKCFFSLLNINFPQGPYRIKLGEYNENIIKLYYLFLNELIILLFYMDSKDLGLKLSDLYLLNAPNYISKIEPTNNQKFYTNALNMISKHQLKIELESGWYEFNPSIIQMNGEYVASLRTTNYTVNDQGYYILPENVTISQSVNYMLNLGTDFSIKKVTKINDISVYNKYEGSRFQGLEDIILFENNNDICFTCTTLDTNQNRIPQISLCKLNNNYEVDTKYPLDSPNGNMQKNWLPFMHNDKLFLIYSYEPFIIFEHIQDSLYIQICNKKYNLNFGGFKGSTAPIIFDNGYLFIIHETHNINVNLRCYLHRFIWMTSDFEIKSISHPWHLQHFGIEFCRSMCWSYNKEIIITYGIKDKEAYIGIVDPEYIKLLLLNIEDLTF